MLLAAAHDGEGWAYERLFRELAPAVRGYLRLQGAREPDDLTSEVFAGAFANLAGFAGDEAAFRSWLFTIAYRRLVDEHRYWGRRPTLSGGPIGPSAADAEVREAGDAETDALRSLADERVRHLLGALSADQRNVLLLRVVADLGIDQVAEILGKRATAVKALQRRGLAGLRRTLVKAAGVRSGIEMTERDDCRG